MIEIKFRQPIFDSKGYFKEYHYLGFLVDGFEGPASYLNAKQNIDFKLIQEQYTGLKDKNGREIYEGDIVEYNKIMWNNDKRIKNEIAFERGIFRLKGSTSLSIVCSPDFESEVIGNIHEHSELIKD